VAATTTVAVRPGRAAEAVGCGGYPAVSSSPIAMT
jgi:hypothetical protein